MNAQMQTEAVIATSHLWPRHIDAEASSIIPGAVQTHARFELLDVVHHGDLAEPD